MKKAMLLGLVMLAGCGGVESDVDEVQAAESSAPEADGVVHAQAKICNTSFSYSTLKVCQYGQLDMRKTGHTITRSCYDDGSVWKFWAYVSC